MLLSSTIRLHSHIVMYIIVHRRAAVWTLLQRFSLRRRMNGTLVVCVERRGHFLFISHFQVSEIQIFQKYQKQTNREEKKHVTVKGTYKPLGHIQNHQCAS